MKHNQNNNNPKNMIYTSTVMTGSISWDEVKNVLNSFLAVLSIILTKYLEISGLTGKAFNMLALLLLADTITGWIKARKIGEYKRKKFYYGVIGKMVMLFIPIVLKAFTEFAGVQGTMMFNTYCILIAAHETESFFGNFYTIRTGKVLPEKDILSILSKKMHDLVGNFIEKIRFTKEDKPGDNNNNADGK